MAVKKVIESSATRENLQAILWVSTVRWALQWLEAFSQRGGGWVGLKYVFQFPEWDGSIFPCPLWLFLWVRTGKLNMNSCCLYGGIKSSHSDLLFIFIWDGGGCLLQGFKNASLFSLQMTDRTQTWADGYLASVSVREVTELSCHISWAAVVVVLALMLNFVVLLGLTGHCFLRTKWVLFPETPAVQLLW